MGIDLQPIEEETVRGYEVVTSDRRRVGRVADVVDGFLLVASGWLGRSRRLIPREFVHAVDDTRTVLVTVPRRVLDHAPKVGRRGRADTGEAARYYGLAASYLDLAAESLFRGGAGPARGEVIAAAAGGAQRR